MATLLTWGNSEGTKGRCDAKCHNALSSKCDCMCGGRYHGAHGDLGARVIETMEECIRDAEAKAKAEGFELDSGKLKQFRAALAQKWLPGMEVK